MRRQLSALALVCLMGGMVTVIVPVADAAPLNSVALQNTDQSTNAPAGASVSGAAIVQYAMRFLGYPYTTVGNSPSTGFSCIGFVSYVYQSLGIDLPDDLGGAMAFASPVAFSDLQPGDVLYFQNTVWPGLSHAAIYIGGGRMIQAEWYNRGVDISSFTNDPVDGDYWIGHYLGANRPWALDSVAVRPPAPPSSPSTSSGSVVSQEAPVTTVPRTPTGPIAVVGVPYLNVRSGPSVYRYLRSVVARGTRVVLLGHRFGWYRVALPNGARGWVVGAGLGRGYGAAYGGLRRTVRTYLATSPRTSYRASQGFSTHGTVDVRVLDLRVHSGPAITAPVTGMVGLGQHLTVLRRTPAWTKVILGSGATGWISSAYVRPTSYRGPSRAASTPRTVAQRSFTRVNTTFTRVPGSIAQVALNVRQEPSLSGAVLSIVAPGGSFHILGQSDDWARVQLASGELGWISETVLGGTMIRHATVSIARPAHAIAIAPTSPSRSVVTAGVRIHTGPGVSQPVLGLVAAGTKVQTIGATDGWTKVRLPSHQTGYILGAYVRQ